MDTNKFALTEDSQGIRRFDDASLQSAIDSAIRRRSPNKDLVVVAHADDQKLYFSAAYKMKDDWTIVAAAYKSKDKPAGWGYGAEVIWEPF